MLFKSTQNHKRSTSGHEFHKLQSKHNGALRVLGVLATSPMQKSGFHRLQCQRKTIRKVLLPPHSPPNRC